jgi:hypothetical protein
VNGSGGEFLRLLWQRRFRSQAQDPAFILFHLKVQNAVGEDNRMVDASIAPSRAYSDLPADGQ